MLFATNEEYFRGAKWAMQGVSDLRLCPDSWKEKMEALLCGGLSPQCLHEPFLQAKSLTMSIVELASGQGEEEKEAIQSGFWDWPDISICSNSDDLAYHGFGFKFWRCAF